MAKKLSNNSIDKIIKNVAKTCEEIGVVCSSDGETVSFEVSWDTDIGKRMQSIMDGVLLAWDEEGNFMSPLSSLAYTYALLSCFTNIKTEKIEKIYALSQLTNIVEMVEEVLPSRVRKDFKKDFNECFNYNKNRNLRLNNVDEICSSVGEIVSKFGGIVENITPDTINTIFGTEDTPSLSLVNKDE